MKDKGKRPRRSKRKGEAGAAPAAILSDRQWNWAAPLAYLVLTLILFGPFLFSGNMLFGTDTLPMGYAARKVYTDLFRSLGTLPLWNPYIMGGIPMVDGLVGGDMFYPTTALQFLMPVHRAIGVKLVIHIFLAGWFFYLFARRKGVGPGPSLVGGGAYMFAPYIISLIYAGHDGKLFVASLLPLGFLALERLLQRARFADLLFFGFTIGLMILTAHLQLAFFACGAFGFRFIWSILSDWKRGERSRVGRVAVLFVGAALLGAALGAVQTYPAYVYTSTFSPRAGGVDYEFATSWSIHWEEVVSLVVPEFGGYLDGYWGKNPFKLNCESPGFLVMMLVIAGFFRIRRDKELLFWYLLLLVTLIYGLGAETPFFRLIYLVVPKFFRAPSTILFLFSFSAAFVGVRVLEAFLTGKDRRGIRIGFALTGALLLLLLLLVSVGEPFFRAWGGIFHEGLAGEKLARAVQNAAAAQRGIGISLLLGGLFALLLEGIVRSRRPLEYALFPALLLVFLGDLRTDRDFVEAVPLERYVRENEMVRKLKEDPGIFRVFSAVPNLHGNYFSIFGIEAARGFFDNRTRWYDEVASPQNLQNPNIMNLLNIKYIVAAEGIRHPMFTPLLSQGGVALYENRDVLPRAFLVGGYEVVEDRERILAMLKSEGFDPTEEILLESDPGFSSSAGAGPMRSASVTWEEYTANRIRLSTEAEGDALLFLSNTYLPYWRAAVDGEERPVLRANYAFQAVAVPEGEHEVVFWYHSPPLAAAGAVSLVAVGILLVGGVASRARRRKEGEISDG